MPFLASLSGRRGPRKRRFGRGSDACDWDFGIAEPRSGAVHGHFSPTPDSGPSAPLRERGRIARPKGETADGRTIVAFLKEGHQNVIVVLDASPGDAPSHPDAKGTVTLQYVVGDTSVGPATEEPSERHHN